MESTQAGKEFLALNMFNPRFEMLPEKVHELWCMLEQRFAEGAEGKVTIIANSVVEGSVFAKDLISLGSGLGKAEDIVTGVSKLDKMEDTITGVSKLDNVDDSIKGLNKLDAAGDAVTGVKKADDVEDATKVARKTGVGVTGEVYL